MGEYQGKAESIASSFQPVGRMLARGEKSVLEQLFCMQKYGVLIGKSAESLTLIYEGLQGLGCSGRADQALATSCHWIPFKIEMHSIY